MVNIFRPVSDMLVTGIYLPIESSQDYFPSSNGIARGSRELPGCRTSGCVLVSVDFRFLLIKLLKVSSSCPRLFPVEAMWNGLSRNNFLGTSNLSTKSE